MSEPLQSGFQDTAFPPHVLVRLDDVVEREWEALPGKPSIKDSLVAGAFLVTYLAAYLAAGRAGIAIIEWAWVAIFR